MSTNSDPFRTPSSSQPTSRLTRSTLKRDTLAAELEKDPQLSTAKRQQRSQAFTSTVAHASLERQLAALKTYKVELEQKLRDKDLQVDQLERDRRSIAELEKKEREEKERERVEYDEHRRKLDAELRTLRATLNNLREEHADSQDAYSTLSRTTNHTIASQSTQLATLTRQTQLLTTQLTETQSLNTTLASEVADLHSELDELRSDNSKLSKDRVEVQEMGVVREELHRQAAYVKEMERKNDKLLSELRILRERQTSVEVLREEKRALEKKVAGMEEMRDKVVRLEAEIVAARRERDEWVQRSTSPSSLNSTAPSITTTATLSTLRLEHVKLLEDHGATVATLRQRESQITELEGQVKENQQTIESLEANVRILEGKAERSERRAVLGEREIGFLKAMVASYNAEASQDNQGDESTTAIPNSALSLRVQQLEELLAEYRVTIDELRGTLDQIGADPKNGGNDVQRLKSELDEAIKDRDTLKDELKAQESQTQAHLTQIDSLEQQLFELSGEIAGGRHVPPGVRVLSMKGNPEEEWFALRKEAMEKLRSENEALMKRLRELEERAPVDQAQPSVDLNASHLVPRESYDLAVGEVTSLTSQLTQKDKRLQRLQQVFASKSAEFRDAIASIMGVKLAFYPNGQVRVTSIYDLNASFVFQPERGGGGTMQLVGQGEEVSEDLLALMQTWIVKEQCIPAFVALVTLDCYEKAKAEGGL